MSHVPLSGHRHLLAFSHASSPTGTVNMNEATLNSDLVVILAALICALISGLAVVSLLSCALRCNRRMVLHSSHEVVNTSLEKEAMKALPIIVYTDAASKPPGLATDCPICLGEFVEGETMRVLPKCNHGFHLECIDKWFVSHSSCPLCRHCLNLVRNKKPGGAAIAEATESNNGVDIVIENITDSTQPIQVTPRSTQNWERTPEEAGATNPSRFRSPS